jgi:hypothetical protein
MNAAATYPSAQQLALEARLEQLEQTEQRIDEKLDLLNRSLQQIRQLQSSQRQADGQSNASQASGAGPLRPIPQARPIVPQYQPPQQQAPRYDEQPAAYVQASGPAHASVAAPRSVIHQPTETFHSSAAQPRLLPVEGRITGLGK